MLFCASKVWTQGGYEANYVTHAKFQAAIASDPTLLHTFLELCKELIRLKILDPNCKFRLEANLAQVMEKITTSQNRKQGLKAPKTHFVEESAFEAHFGRKAYDEELVVEEFNGTRMRGVNVLTGKAGWFERIDDQTQEVGRQATLTDDINLDKSGKAYDNIFAAAKKEVMSKHTPSVEAGLAEGMNNLEPNQCGAAGAEPNSESDDDEGPAGLFAFLKDRFQGKTTKPKASAKPSAKAAAGKSPSKPKRTITEVPPSAEKGPEHEPLRKRSRAAGTASTKPKAKASKKDKPDKAEDDVQVEDEGADQPEEMSTADKVTVSGFEKKLMDIGCLEPPIGDAAFKQYMQEKTHSPIFHESRDAGEEEECVSEEQQD
ncbi:unnamed protein product [Durusdinium trenchii]|uniref:Uncharacterized protein n=1 Tax=Durusdinium trenchii TaxID=1381693 RepID=A0ABP0NNF6_9DINO